MKSQYRFTRMSMAFVDSAVRAPRRHPVVGSIIKASEKESGRVLERGWNANLAFRTAMNLKAAGILS